MTPAQRALAAAKTPTFDDLCEMFTFWTEKAYRWKYAYSGAAYSTRIKAAIVDLKAAIAECEKHSELADLCPAIEEEIEARGTYACPICGVAKPHHHPEGQVAAYHEDLVRADGWTSAAHREPEKSGWYLCLGVEIDRDQYGEKKDFWTANERWSQLSWFLWVRSGGSRSDMEREIPEVLYFDQYSWNPGWKLRNLLGNAVVSGAESRFDVDARPRYWRNVPNGIAALPTAPTTAGEEG